MRKILIPLTVAFVVLACAGTAAAAPSYLFSGFASTATFSGHGASATITVPSRTKLTWFTDRPDRVAGGTTVAQLARTWAANGFDDVPPNAAITVGRDGASSSYVLTLAKPRIMGAMTRFTYRILPKGSMLGMGTDGRLANGVKRSVGLFIDGGAGCWSSTLGVGSDCEMFSFTSYSVAAPPAGGTYNVNLCDANDAWHQYNTTVTKNGVVIYSSPPRACPDGGYRFSVGPTDSVQIRNGDLTTHIWITS